MTAIAGNVALNGAGGRGGISAGNPNIILFGEEDTMKSLRTTCLLIALIFFLPLAADAQQVKDYSSTINSFKSSPQLQWFFDNAYGYAVFPCRGQGRAHRWRGLRTGAGLPPRGGHRDGGSAPGLHWFPVGRAGFQRDHFLPGQVGLRRLHARSVRIRRQRFGRG